LHSNWIFDSYSYCYYYHYYYYYYFLELLQLLQPKKKTASVLSSMAVMHMHTHTTKVADTTTACQTLKATKGPGASILGFAWLKRSLRLCLATQGLFSQDGVTQTSIASFKAEESKWLRCACRLRIPATMEEPEPKVVMFISTLSFEDRQFIYKTCKEVNFENVEAMTLSIQYPTCVRGIVESLDFPFSN